MMKLSLLLISAFSTLVASQDYYFAPHKRPDVVPLEPTPGSVEVSLSVQSLNNILQLAAPLAANEIFNNKTFELDYQRQGLLKIYNFQVDQIHTYSVDGFEVKDFSFKNNTNILVLTVGGVNINATMEGEASCVWLIKGHFEAFTITNLTMVIEIEIENKEDDVHYKVL